MDLPAAPASAPAWSLRLLGDIQAHHGSQRISRWPSRHAAALLARLALEPLRSHPREELIELLWPGVELTVGRNRLRQVLATLRELLHRPGQPPVIDADRQALRLHPGALRCDAIDFEQLARRGAAAPARALYGGELMPGHYDDWVLERRRQLAALHEQLADTTLPDPEAPLPAVWTPAFGLEAPLQALPALLAAHRLVSVVGPGGCGKTRLALELAHRLRGHTAAFDRVAFVALADCRDDTQALAALARTLNLPGADTTGQLANWLGGQRLLLVLDNLEQLPQGGATLVLRLLEQVPSAWLLATSRRPCNLAGERLFALRGLPLPTEDGAHNPAVALFVDRAQAIQPGWQPGAAELADVAALVRRLDGLPLALELAASRLPGRSTAQLLQLLDGSADDAPHLQLLSRPGPRAGHDPRPAAIEHVVDWSWQLLSADEQQVLAAVALAHGGCAPALLARWLARPAATVAGCTDALQSHALLRQQPGPDGRARLWAPEPVREFVRQRLDGPSRLALQLALRDVLLAWAQDLGPSPAPQRVEAEIGQVLALLHDGLPPLAPTLQLMLALRSHWDNRGMPAAAQDDLERALDLHQAEGGDPALTGDVHELLAYVRFEAGFAPQARQHARQALQRAGTDPARRARALTRAAWVTLASGRSHDDQAPQAVLLQQQLNEALQLAQRSGDRDAQARALHQLAVLHSHLNHDEARAEALLAQSQALWLALGDRRKAFARLRNRGQCWLAQGRSSDAQACFEQCAQVAADEGDVLGQIDSLLSLSTLLARQRRWQQALDCDRRCLRLCWQHRHRHGLAYALWNPARPLARLRRPEAAMRVMAFAATFWERSFGPLAAADRRTVRQVHRLVRAQLGAARAEALWTDGASLPIADVVALALRD
jgi:predicted ATPase